ncbi:MAG TPA: hypothetical protein VNZ26_11295 [Vicinamibacterales bacterium]|jgi:hypothetical protein|nr:hypothetical protein [Vicinamibacterales bacterium]
MAVTRDEQDFTLVVVAGATQHTETTQEFVFVLGPTMTPLTQPDEDFWQNAVAPVVAANYVELPFLDPEEIPAGHLFVGLDEDFWLNPVAPVAASNYVRWPRGVGDSDSDSDAVLFRTSRGFFWVIT